MPAYLIVDTEIENADEYEIYKALAKPITEQYVRRSGAFMPFGYRLTRHGSVSDCLAVWGSGPPGVQ